MAKLLTKTFNISSEVATETLTANFHVNNEGVFSTVLPEKYDDIVLNLLKDNQKVFAAQNNSHVLGKKAPLHIKAKVLQDLEIFISSVLKSYVSCTFVKERVILYGTDINAHFWINPDGTLATNGYTGDKSGVWSAISAHRCQSNYYNVGFIAVVRDKYTYSKLGCTDKVIYEYPPYENFSFKTAGEILNSFTNVNITGIKLKELPYTEEAARFFIDIMFGICTIAGRLDAFINSPDVLNVAINDKIKVLTFKQENTNG